VEATEDRRPERVAFLGDSYTGGSGEGGVGATGWPAIVSAAQGWSFDRNGPLFNAQGGTGYVQAGGEKQPYSGRVDAVIAANPTTVIVAGGINDEGYSLEEISSAANDVFSRLRTGLPDANIIVVGPFYPSSPPSEKIQQVRDAVFEAALANGITNVIDPLPWLDSPGIEIGSDGIHPTDAGHQAIADQMNAALAPYLADLE
jgi:lysophospholipase L1-like esterase